MSIPCPLNKAKEHPFSTAGPAETSLVATIVQDKKKNHTADLSSVSSTNTSRARAVARPSPTDTSQDNPISLDALTEQLRKNLNVSWTYVNVLDADRQWRTTSIAEREGMPLFATNRNDLTDRRAVADTTPLLSEDEESKLTEVYDTWEDERFRENPYVQPSTRLYSVRFYAATPIECNGSRIGKLCVFNYEPKRLTMDETRMIQEYAATIGRRYVTTVHGTSGKVDGRRRRKRSTSRDDLEIGRRNRMNSSKSPSSKRRSISCEPVTLPKSEPVATLATPKTNIIENPLAPKVALPDPKTSSADPDEYLAQLVKALSPSNNVQLQIRPSQSMEDYFPEVTEQQMARYNVQVISMARNNDLTSIKALFAANGRDALDCYNRFGEGLLTLACRRGFQEMTEFFLSENVNLPVRVRDDYGRTPVHDACWNPSPQLEICAWIMRKDPSLFLLADKRGFTAFQYARKSDWHIWRQFLFDNRDMLLPLTQPEIAKRFAP